MFLPWAVASFAVVGGVGCACITRLAMRFLDDLVVLGRMAGLAYFYACIGATGFNQRLQAVGGLLLFGSGHGAMQQQAQKRYQIERVAK